LDPPSKWTGNASLRYLFPWGPDNVIRDVDSDPHVGRKPALVVMMIILLSTAALSKDEPRRIKVIGTGRAVGMPILTSWFLTEPSTDPLIIPTRAHGEVEAADIRRFVRIYFPRSYSNLLEYEFFFLDQVDMFTLSDQQQRWLCDALKNHRKGAVNTRSAMSVNANFYMPWVESELSDAFPNDAAAVIADNANFHAPTGPLVIRDDRDLPGIMKPYRDMIERLFPVYVSHHNNFPLTIPRPGSTVLSYTRNSMGIGFPIPGQIAQVFYWSWNRSITFTTRGVVYDPFWSASPTGSHAANPYALDIIANIVWFSTGRELPDDPSRVHDFRRDLFDFGLQQSLLTSLLDFAEIFGANPADEYSRLADVQAIRTRANDHYLDGDFNAAHETMQVALDTLAELEEDVSKLKDRAMMWVYIVEWSVTTSVFLLTGFVLWTLMVRRRFYREVATTKQFR